MSNSITSHPTTEAERVAWLAARARNINSTESAALFGISPYMSHLDLWLLKSGQSEKPFIETERTKWGKRLEATVAEAFAEETSIAVIPHDEYRETAGRIGASFDYLAGPAALLECKNVDSLIFRRQWSEDGDNLNVPVWIEMQVQHQMLVADIDTAYIAVLVGGNRLVWTKREADPAIHAALRSKVAAFWRSVEAGERPAAKYPDDAGTVALLYGSAKEGTFVNMAGRTEFEYACTEYKDAAEAEKAAKAIKETAKARILELIGDAERAAGDHFKVSAGMVKETEVSYTRKAYRNFRVT